MATKKQTKQTGISVQNLPIDTFSCIFYGTSVEKYLSYNIKLPSSWIPVIGKDDCYDDGWIILHLMNIGDLVSEQYITCGVDVYDNPVNFNTDKKFAIHIDEILIPAKAEVSVSDFINQRK